MRAEHGINTREGVRKAAGLLHLCAQMTFQATQDKRNIIHPGVYGFGCVPNSSSCCVARPNLIFWFLIPPLMAFKVYFGRWLGTLQDVLHVLEDLLLLTTSPGTVFALRSLLSVSSCSYGSYVRLLDACLFGCLFL